MRSYEMTGYADAIADSSGLRAMVERLIADERLDGLVNNLTSSWHSHSDESDSDVVAERVWLKLHDDDKADFYKGFSVDEAAGWHRLGGWSEDTLVALPNMKRFAGVAEEDRLVLSGLIGLQYLNYRNNCHLLARSRYSEYGFKSFIESAGFVGAYVLTRAHQAEKDKFGSLLGPIPSFDYLDDGMTHEISVGGTIDGDMRLYEKQYCSDRIALAPNKKFVDFSPALETTVGAYHSTEPAVVASMLEYVLLREGRSALKQLLDDFTQQLLLIQGEDEAIGYRAGPFGDYGDGHADYELMELRFLLESPELFQKKQAESEICSMSYLPQSPLHFEILQAEKGLIFQNRDIRADEVGSQIELPRQKFPELFNALVRQAQAGLGRTSPLQHIQLLQEAAKLLAD